MTPYRVKGVCMKLIQSDFKVADVLDKPLMAHLASSSQNGPCSSPLWFLYEKEKIWLFGIDTDSFIQRLENNPRCALSIVDFDLEGGILRHVGIRGVAAVWPCDVARLKRFVGKYLGHNEKAWNEWFISNIVNPLNRMVEVEFDTVVAKDVSFFKTGPDLVK